MGSDTVNITILLDNQAEDGLLAEHGLSLWIEADGKKVLFDTGQSRDAWQENAKALGINVQSPDMLVLSHGHCDHTGGLPSILRNGHPIHVYAHPRVVQPRYSVRDNLSDPIHMSRESMHSLDKVKEQQMHWLYSPVNLTDRIGLTGPVPREMDFENTGGPFFLDPEGKRRDSIEDDLSLWIKTDQGMVICTGCCHSGLVNTVNYIRRLNPGWDIRAVIGGFHLVSASMNRLTHTTQALDEYGVEEIIPLHCTGDEATRFLASRLGGRVSPGKAGQTYRF